MPRLLKLTLTLFRNYRHLTWQPENALTVLTGENGSGKTNLLESLSLFAPGRGLRRASLSQLGHHETSGWGVAARFQLNDEIIDLGTAVSETGRGQRRNFLLNGKPFPKKEGVEDLLSVIWITPQMDRLFSENASGRRRFFDRLVMTVLPGHARELAAYERAMTQRNKLLLTRPTETSWLSGLESTMARHGVAISAARNEIAYYLSSFAQTHKSAFPASHVTFDCDLSEQIQKKPALTVEDWFKEKLNLSRSEDRQRGRTSIGPHRSDFMLSDWKTGLPAHTASTGQQKAMLLGLTLAQTALVREYRKASPLLLLDEPLVHLDRYKREALLEYLPSLQTTILLTGTDSAPFEKISDMARFITLKNGSFQV